MCLRLHGRRGYAAWSAQLTADKTIDGNAQTRWNSAHGDVAGSWLAIDFGRPRRISWIRFTEAAGGRITGYTVQAWTDGQWRDVAAMVKPAEQTTVRCRFREVTTTQVRLLITAAKAVPTIYELEIR
jgi:hypothetical protein